jgi:lysozyme
MMTASRRAVALIVQFEDYRDAAYRDAAGIWTIGFGTTRGVKQGDRIAFRQAFEMFMADVQEAEGHVIRNIQVPVAQHEFDALVSFTYNVGGGALLRSTLRRKLNAGDREGAAAEFGRWVNAGGRKLAGLVRRREAEAGMFRGI